MLILTYNDCFFFPLSCSDSWKEKCKSKCLSVLDLYQLPCLRVTPSLHSVALVLFEFSTQYVVFITKYQEPYLP